MPRKSSHKGCRLDCGAVYDNAVKVAKQKYNEDVADVYEYDNGAVGVFLKSGKFRFIQGSTPETLAKLRSKRSSSKRSSSKRSSSKRSSSKRSSSKRSSSKKASLKHSSKKQKGGEIDNMLKRLDDISTEKKEDEETISGGSKKKKLSLKSAVQLLRKYYSEKFRK
jgi:hypothetical protein